MSVSEFLFNLESEIGKITDIESVCPGTYYFTARQNGESISHEYYLVMEDSPVFHSIQKYGKQIQKSKLFPMDNPASGWKIVEYEVYKYLQKNHQPLPQGVSLHENAVYAAEYHPEFFGTYPVPLQTSRGYTLQYYSFENGIYWIETSQCEEVLAVCYPIWSAELSSFACGIGEQSDADRLLDIHQTMGYLFFPKDNCSIPVFELLQTRPGWNGKLVDIPALMNVIWKRAPEYALINNVREQAGLNDFISGLFHGFGVEVEPHCSIDHMFSVFPDAGEDFLLFEGF